MLRFSWKKMLNWFFWIVLLGVGIAFLGMAWLFIQANQGKDTLTGIIRANPNTTAITAYTVDANGQQVADGQELFFNADTPLVLASTMKTVVLAAYENAVAGGELDPNQKISITDLEKYYLPQTDGGAHVAGLAELGLSADANGFASDQTAAIPLDAVARIMINNSGNAEMDYLLSRLGEERMNAALSAAGMQQHTRFHSILGITLAMFNHEAPLIDPTRRQVLINQAASGDFSTLEHLADLYLHDPKWRAAQIAFMQSDAFTNAANQMGWEGQVAASQLFPKGTAREYAGLMAQIASGQFISPAVSARIQQKLENIPDEQPMRWLFHQRYGAKGGLTAGVLNLVSYAVPKSGPLAGQTRVIVILTNELPYETWTSLAQFQSVYLLQADLAKAKKIFDAKQALH
jgi:D-alanyl-D-alanine carboxypeptidase